MSKLITAKNWGRSKKVSASKRIQIIKSKKKRVVAPAKAGRLRDK